MSEHQRETEFLRHCLSYDTSPRRQELDERVAQIQRDERCVRRAAWLMAIPVALSVAGFGYGAALGDNFPDNTPQFVIKTISALGVCSLVSLLALLVLGIAYRRKLDQRREECRQIVHRLLEVRFGKPVVAASPSGVINKPANMGPGNEMATSAPEVNLSRAL